MKVVILGCGRIGSNLAASMSRDGHDVIVIDRENNAFRRLSPEFKGITVVGNGTDQAVLKRAGIDGADAFVAVTNGDNTNLMSVQIAKVQFKVPRCIARVYDPIRACAYQDLGVETLCTSLVAARILQSTLLGKDLGSAEQYCSLVEEDLVM